jgi:hypothetical protein
MKRSLLLAVALVLVMAAPASAHHGDQPDRYIDGGSYLADVWPNSGTELYCIDPAWEDAYVQNAVDQMKASTNTAFNHIRNVTDFNRVFDRDGECPNYVNVMNAWDQADVTKSGFLGESQKEEFCAEYLTGVASRIEYEELSGPRALEIDCDRDNNGTLDWFVIIIDVKTETWYWDSSPPTATRPYSFWATITHEAVHATGFTGHWPNDSETCPDNGNHNTMCDDGYGWAYNGGGVADATLESHDIGEINQAY